METHNVKLKCPQCNYTYASEFGLFLHVHDHSQDSTPHKSIHQCTVCDMVFTFKQDLRNHTERRHVSKPLHMATSMKALVPLLRMILMLWQGLIRLKHAFSSQLRAWPGFTSDIASSLEGASETYKLQIPMIKPSPLMPTRCS